MDKAGHLPSRFDSLRAINSLNQEINHMEHPLYYAIDYDLNVIKLGYFDNYHLACLYAEKKEIEFMKIFNHAELVTLYNNIDAATSDCWS
jgi:hypothetical protein